MHSGVKEFGKATTTMFQSATIKLTAWYLALIMGLSLMFSVVLYNASSDSLSSGFERQRSAFRQQVLDAYGLPSSGFDFDRLRNREIDAAERRLIASLTLINMAVLAAGGAASFYLARRTLRPIERAMDAQARFTADASHELRTPLTAMQAEIEVALRDKLMTAAQARKLLSSNLEEVTKLQALSDGLLTLASQDGNDHLRVEPVQLQTIVREAIRRTAKLADRKHIMIEDKTTDSVAHGDADSLTQVVAILLDNAIKYSAENTVVMINSFVKGGSAHLVVADHGQGIKSDDLPYIFDRLYRADSSRGKKVDGYGLGLSIAKKIVEFHKGAIDVTSAIGQGSTFTVRLPIATSKKGPTHEPADAHKA